MRFTIQREGGWMPYSWHGMRFRTWLGLLRRGRFRVTLNCVPHCVSVTVVSLLNSLLYRVSEGVYRRRAEAVEFTQPPIFVIGHWRSGTTYVHELLACDPTLGYCDFHQALFPNQFVLTDRIVGDWFNFFLPPRRPMDRMVMDVKKPQEDEFALCNLGVPSPYLTMAFPREGRACYEYLDLRELTDRQRQAWCDKFMWYMRRLALQEQGRGKRRLVLKSPTHTARIRTLLTLFPDAKFIYIARDPYEVFASTMRLWKSMNSVQGLHNPANDDPWLKDYVLDAFELMFRRYEEDKVLIPAGNLAEIRFEELVKTPKESMRKLYHDLGLGDFATAEPGIDDYLAATSQHIRFPLQMAGGDVGTIRERWSAYIERFGYLDVPELLPAEREGAGGPS